MTTDQINFFFTLAKCQHLTYAADQLHISQPALSHNLQRLEEEVGYPLFDRVGRGIKLNKNGEIFLEHCRSILDSYENALTEIKQLNNELSNTIKILWSQKFAIDHYLLSFIDNNPDISVDFTRCETQEATEALDAGQCDFAIIHTVKDQWSKFSYVSIPAPCWYIAISSNDPLASRGMPPRISDLKGKNFVCFAMDEHHKMMTKRLCRKAGFDANISFETTPRRCLDLVAGRGWALLCPSDDFILASGNTYYRELVSFSPLYPQDYDSESRILYNEKKTFSEPCKKFFDYVTSLDGAANITLKDFLPVDR